ncbi:LacI family DNA-binding transcriptional regulator [uncultured Allofournierella sp.]|uniref:LacI family DNA-binding transcriptional regulator n=1 Tax=uncultured Allofournierella sp. TaxID=1940258 RepID=UPI000B3701CD|nr:LacI family DNA-binding transcriptional regulator [uncultured Fournierella sp.]OUN15562.1 transcriptional regulator [Gemmiger sp. An87]
MKRKTATMKDIADQLGLSVNAVSLALKDRPGVSDETRRQVIEIAQNIGYEIKQAKPAGPARVPGSKNICVLLRHRFFRDFRFYGRILLGIEEAAKKDGYDVIISSFEAEEVPASVQENRVSGVIVVGSIDDNFLARLMEYNIPIVLADHQSNSHQLDCVVSDNYFGAYRMTVELIRRGYTRIGFFGDREYTPSTRDRFLGVLKALQDHLKLKGFRESVDYLERFSACGDIENYVIQQDGAHLLELYRNIPEKPEALVCSNDELAILLMQTLQKNGISVPEDVGVAGFDDIEPGRMVTPPLTTVHVQKKLMGQKAVERLLHRIACPDEIPVKLALSVTIVERESV